MSLPFGTWPSLKYQVSGFGPLEPTRDFYVRTPANGGNDTTGQGTIQRPFATPQRAISDVQRRQCRARVHIGSGQYDCPVLQNLYGSVAILGDGGGSPLDDGFSEQLGPTAAGAATTAGRVAGTFVPNSFDRMTLQILTGSGAGQFRSIAETTATELILARNSFIGVGDLYRIVEPNIFFVMAPPIGPSPISETWIANCGSAGGVVYNITTSFDRPDALAEVMHFVNIRFLGDSGRAVAISGSNVGFYGCQDTSNLGIEARGSALNFGADSIIGDATGIAALLGQDVSAYAGWGWQGSSATHVNASADATIIGYFANAAQRLFAVGGGKITYLGGLVNQMQAIAGGFLALDPTFSPRLRVAGSSGLTVSTFAFAIIDGGELAASSGDAIRASQGGAVSAAGTTVVTAAVGNACRVSQGGQCYLRSSPAATWAGVAGDFRVSATEAAAAATFSAVDVTLAAAVANGSVVTRVN